MFRRIATRVLLCPPITTGYFFKPEVSPVVATVVPQAPALANIPVPDSQDVSSNPEVRGTLTTCEIRATLNFPVDDVATHPQEGTAEEEENPAEQCTPSKKAIRKSAKKSKTGADKAKNKKTTKKTKKFVKKTKSATKKTVKTAPKSKAKKNSKKPKAIKKPKSGKK